MNHSQLEIGLTHQDGFIVEPRHTVPQVDTNWPGFQDMPPLLATAYMIGFMEQTCIQALRPYLAPGEHTLGIAVDMTHESPTQAGSLVKATVELVKIEGKVLHFHVSCLDDKGLIGRGTHKRAIIQVERFLTRIKSTK
ncbi:thioesterase family protein [Klebsiella spallanzanii]|uniref:thioesterase family protein n=1 Tax=Klebsiella spallanzanii TaxID=2587528 RepID=UPI001119F9C5|nr:thioesterase family protein [Klebsiella spallanzanii]